MRPLVRQKYYLDQVNVLAILDILKKIFPQNEKRAESPSETVMVSFDSDFFTALVGAGNPITKQKALEIPAVQFCIELFSGLISALPVKLYEESESGEVTEIKDDPRIRMLNGDTGDTVNGTMFRRLWVRDYFLGGGAYAYIERDIYGMPAALYYVDESKISAIPNCMAIFKDYSFSVDGRTYPKCDFVKILRNSRGYGKGTGIVSESGTILATAYNTLLYENDLVFNGGNKSGVFTSQTQQTKEAMETVKENWRKMNSNSRNKADKVFVLNAGMDFKEMSQTAMDMQLNQNKQTNSGEVCGIFGVPSGMMSGNVSAEAKENFITDVFTPLLNVFETAFDSDMLLEAEKGKRYFAFDTRELTRGDILKRYQAYAIGKKNGFIFIDDIRKQEDLSPIDFPYIQLGLADVLYNPQTGEIYTPNTDVVINLKDSGRQFLNRGGNEVSQDIKEHAEELRYNPYYDPTNGRFTTSSGGGMGAVLHVAKGQKGKGEYVFAKEHSGTDNADFAERNSKFIKENKRLSNHYSDLLKSGDLNSEEYSEAISGLAHNIRENGSYTMIDRNNSLIKTNGTLFDYDGRTFGYNNIDGRDYVTDVKTSAFLPVQKGNIRQFGDTEHDVIDTAETLKYVINRNKRAVPINSGNTEELRFNPNHDPKNGKFTSGSGSSLKALTGSENGGIIKSGSDSMNITNVEIDRLTPCLCRNSDGKTVDTSVEKISPDAESFSDWEFDWTEPEKDGYSVFALKADGDDRVQGLISLINDKNDYAVNIGIVEAAPHNNVHNPNNKSGQKEYDGVGGHLFAEAVRQSKNAGYDGFVFFDAKTDLIGHYKEHIGATQIGNSQRMFIDEIAAESLLNKYYGGNGNE